MDGYLNRRTWARSAAGLVLLPTLLRADDPLAAEVAAVEAIGRSARLGPFGRTETPHYLGLGNATAAYRAEALDASERLAAGFLEHFKGKGFDNLALPAGRMTVVILDTPKSYARYAGADENLTIGGHYEVDTNRLVVFDFRDNQAPNARLLNTLTLTHEATHQLTYNVGLLDRRGDVPDCVSEGLATYGETWHPKGKGVVGQVNRDRLFALRVERNKVTPWFDVARLIVDDKLLSDEATRDAAYAESWVFVHAHMKTPARLRRFQAYLKAIRGRRDPSHRLEDARAHLGDLQKLDAELRAYASRPSGK